MTIEERSLLGLAPWLLASATKRKIPPPNTAELLATFIPGAAPVIYGGRLLNAAFGSQPADPRAIRELTGEAYVQPTGAMPKGFKGRLPMTLSKSLHRALARGIMGARGRIKRMPGGGDYLDQFSIFSPLFGQDVPLPPQMAESIRNVKSRVVTRHPLGITAGGQRARNRFIQRRLSDPARYKLGGSFQRDYKREYLPSEWRKMTEEGTTPGWRYGGY